MNNHYTTESSPGGEERGKNGGMGRGYEWYQLEWERGDRDGTEGGGRREKETAKAKRKMSGKVNVHQPRVWALEHINFVLSQRRATGELEKEEEEMEG